MNQLSLNIGGTNPYVATTTFVVRNKQVDPGQTVELTTLEAAQLLKLGLVTEYAPASFITAKKPSSKPAAKPASKTSLD